MRRPWITLALAALVACGERGDVAQAAETLGPRLAGTWDIRLDLDQRPVLRGQGPGEVRGSIAFLANKRRDGPADYGTYDIDFRPFGFDPRGEGETPVAIARWLPGDSVSITLGPEGAASVAMRGRLAGDSVVGTWDVSLARVSGGGGRFVMQHAP